MHKATRTVVALSGVVVGAWLLGACMPSSEPRGDVGPGPAEGRTVKVDAEDNAFVPSRIRGAAGRTITVEVGNNGDSPHEFAIKDLDLTTGTIGSGETAHARFRVPEGVTEFVCNYHDGMKGTLEGS